MTQTIRYLNLRLGLTTAYEKNRLYRLSSCTNHPTQALPTTSLECCEVIVDNSLRYNTHAKRLNIECNSHMNLLKHISHKTWGVDKKPSRCYASSDEIQVGIR